MRTPQGRFVWEQRFASTVLWSRFAVLVFKVLVNRYRRRPQRFMQRMGTKKGAVSLSLLRKLKWSPGARTPSEHHHHRQVATAVGCCERFPRKDPGVFDLLGPPFSCDTPGLTRLLSKCAYGLPNISGFGGSAPERVRPTPSLGLKGSP